MNNIHTNRSYTISAFLFAILSLVGSFLSVINIITIFTTYQLITDMKKYDHSKIHYICAMGLLIIAIICTFLTTVFYVNH